MTAAANIVGVAEMVENAQPVEAPSDWPEPTPLPSGLLPVDVFNEKLLPQALRAWVMDISHRMSCPPDFVAMAAVTALSSLVGARHVIQPKERDPWRVTPNLWGMAVGRPAVKKSPAINEALKPLVRLEAEEREVFEPLRKEWVTKAKLSEVEAAHAKNAAQKAINKAANAAAGRQDAKAILEEAQQLAEDTEKAEPHARDFIVHDATVEALGVVMERNPWGFLAYRDELHGLLMSLSKQGQEQARGFYLQAFDGDGSYKVLRILRGEHYIPRVCLAMMGSIQPARLQSYVADAMNGGSGDDGLLQRFSLAVWPDIDPQAAYVDQCPDTDAKQAAYAVFERLSKLQPATEKEPVVWRFDTDAQVVYNDWAQGFEVELRSDELHPALVSHLSKYRKLVPALALIFAECDTSNNDCLIGKVHITRALAFTKYLRSHAARIYASGAKPEMAAAASLLNKLQAGKLCTPDGEVLETFTPRLVVQKGWTGLSTTDGVKKAAEVLAEYGWLVAEAVQSDVAGGRPSLRYHVHPKLLSGEVQP